MIKETEKKHEGLAKLKREREKFFFLKKSVWQQKRRATMRRVDKERANIRRVHTKEWKNEQSQQVEKETRNTSIRMRTIKMEI